MRLCKPISRSAPAYAQFDAAINLVRLVSDIVELFDQIWIFLGKGEPQ